MYSRLRAIGFLFGTLYLFSCGSDKFAEKKDLSPAEREKIEQEELKALLNLDYASDSVKLSSFYITTGTRLHAFYTQHKNKLFWFSQGKPKQHTLDFMKFLKSSRYYGLDSGFYYYPQIKAGIDTLPKTVNFYNIAKTQAITDVLLTNAWMLAAVHLNKGCLDPVNMRVSWKVDSLENKNLVDILLQSGDTSLTRRLLAFEPTNIEYRLLKQGLGRFLARHELDTLAFTVPDPKKDSAACWNTLAKALLHWKYIDSVTVARDTLIARIRIFQQENGLDADAIIGNYSRKAFAISNARRFYQAALALEKWRWKAARDGSLQVRVNIPSYTLNVIRNDSLIRTHRVVTGAPDTRSPQLEARIKYITLYPYWNVPHSIASKEISTFLSRDSSYLRKHGYQLFNSDRTPVDLSLVKWRRLNENYFPYRVRQNGGYGNSLGIVVFHFPNKHDVYLHDTPSKSFFNKNLRAFSHGCIRLQDPLLFAEFLLNLDVKRKKDKINVDTLKHWIDRRVEQRIPLKKSIPIELDYITVATGADSSIVFHPDVYGKDVELVQLMNPHTKFKAKPKPAKVKAAEENTKVTVWLDRKKRMPLQG